MINDASFSFKCHYGASFTTDITPSTTNLYPVQAACVKKRTFSHLSLSSLDRLETTWVCLKGFKSINEWGNTMPSEDVSLLIFCYLQSDFYSQIQNVIFFLMYLKDVK